MARSILVASLLVFGLLAGTASRAAAADNRTDTATITYKLDPAKGVIRVTTDLKVTNRTPDSIETYGCIQYSNDGWFGWVPVPSTCERTVQSTVDSTSLWVESGAKSVKVTTTGGGAAVRGNAPDGSLRRVDIGFPALAYQQTRKVRVTYTIPGGKPRSGAGTRALRAYTAFCVQSHGTGAGSVHVQVPVGYKIAVTGGKLKAKTSGKTRVYSSGTIADPASWWACLQGVNESGYTVKQVKAPDGRSVKLQSWPEDRAWTSAVQARLVADLPALQRLIGRPISTTKPLVVKEAASGTEYAGWYDPDTNTVSIGEDYAQGALIGHELAHAWFNGKLFDATWLAEGYAEWAGRTVEPGQPACEQPTQPVAGSASLVLWQRVNPLSTDQDRAAVAYEYDAACYIVSSIAQASGTAGMTRAIEALVDGADPYAVDPGAASGSASAASGAGHGAVSWQRWLDVVDEVALVPAKAPPTLASELLLTYGATTDRETLDARTAARAAYHGLADMVAVDDWIVPTAIRNPLRAWDFVTAETAIRAAGPAWPITGQADAELPGIDARHGPVEAAWEAARTPADLQAATDLAQRQLDAATDVASAAALADAPLDVAQQVGLIGATGPALDDAIAAVRRVDTGEAGRLAASLRSTLGAARSAGQLRIGIAISLVVVSVSLAVLVVLWRRRRPTFAWVLHRPAARSEPEVAASSRPAGTGWSVATPGGRPGSELLSAGPEDSTQVIRLAQGYVHVVADPPDEDVARLVGHPPAPPPPAAPG